MGGRSSGINYLVIAAVAAALLAAQYAWYRANPNIWMGPADGPRMIRVGLESGHPPFSSLDQDGRLVGFEPDLVRAMCQRMEVTCELVPSPWNRILFVLEQGKYDLAVSSTPISEVLTSNLTFSDKTYSLTTLLACCGAEGLGERGAAPAREVPFRFAARKGADISFTQPGMAGKRIGTLRWGSYGELLGDQFPDMTLVPYDRLSDAIADLEAGRIDLLLGDEATLTKALIDTDKGRDFELTGETVHGPQMLGVDAGMTVRKEDADLLPQVNRALQALRADGTYQKLSDKYFGFDIYGS